MQKTNTTGGDDLRTKKKQKVTGIREFVDKETGEIVPMVTTVVTDRDFNFHKIWLQNFVSCVSGIVNKRLAIAFWIIDHLDYDNKLVYTYSQIAKDSGFSKRTVAYAMKALQEGDPAFLVRINQGAYRVNPDVIFKGNQGRRMGIVYEYKTEQEAAREKREAALKAAQVPGQMDLDDLPKPQEVAS